MNYFITGLPRSRTAWFAALFSASKDCFCFHDGLNGCRTVEELKIRLESRPERHVGDSDSGLMILDLERLFPDAKVVLIKRDVEECRESLVEFIGEEYGSTIDYAAMMMENVKDALVVEFDDIDSRIDEIFTYCTGEKLDPDVKGLFLNLHIQLKEFHYDELTLSGIA